MCPKCFRLQSQDDKKVFVNLENCKSILKNTFRWGSLNSKQPKFKKRKKKNSKTITQCLKKYLNLRDE